MLNDIKKIRKNLRGIGIKDEELPDKKIKQMIEDYEFVKKYYIKEKENETKR